MSDTFNRPLAPEHMDHDPVKQLEHWLVEAEAADVTLHNAMTLSTADAQGRPSARIVLLRGVDKVGFIFYTNYTSRKAEEIRENSFVSLVHFWPSLGRQVRIEGQVEMLPAEACDQYFSGRPRGSQIGAHASPQSRVIPDRAWLDRQYDAFEQQFAGQEVPRPSHWGGYRVVPERVEFWQEGVHRLHDRLRYRRNESGQWLIERLAP